MAQSKRTTYRSNNFRPHPYSFSQQQQPEYPYPHSYYSLEQQAPKPVPPAAPSSDDNVVVFFTCKWDNCNALFRMFQDLKNHVIDHLELVNLHAKGSFPSDDSSLDTGRPKQPINESPPPPSSSSSSPAPVRLVYQESDEPCSVCASEFGVPDNAIVTCDSCGMVYHQKCHCPPISARDSEMVWLCAECNAAVAS